MRIFSALYEKCEIHFDPSAVCIVRDKQELRWIIPGSAWNR